MFAVLILGEGGGEEEEEEEEEEDCCTGMPLVVEEKNVSLRP